MPEFPGFKIGIYEFWCIGDFTPSLILLQGKNPTFFNPQFLLLLSERELGPRDAWKGRLIAYKLVA